MSWREEALEIKRRHALAERCGGDVAVERQHAAGKLTVRERIGRLLDPSSFREVGKLAGKAVYQDGKLTEFEPAPYVMGLGRIDERPVAVGGEDYTIRAGTGFGSDRRKGGQGGAIDRLPDPHQNKTGHAREQQGGVGIDQLAHGTAFQVAPVSPPPCGLSSRTLFLAEKCLWRGYLSQSETVFILA